MVHVYVAMLTGRNSAPVRIWFPCHACWPGYPRPRFDNAAIVHRFPVRESRMPELPEAETIARMLHRRLTGRGFGAVEALRADIVHDAPCSLGELLPGRSVVEVTRRAKRVLIHLDDGSVLQVRLGMTGRLTIDRRDQPVEKHTHLRVAIPSSGEELRFRDPRRFGGLWWHPGASRVVESSPKDAARVTKAGRTGSLGRRGGYSASEHGRAFVYGAGDGSTDRRERIDLNGDELGIEPLEMSLAVFREAVSRRRQIKALLMDQRVIAGLGNIYTDESLFAASIHPLRAGDSLSDEESRALWRAIRSILRRAIEFKGTTLVDYRDPDGVEGSFRRYHRVYQREGEACRRCRGTIERMIVAGRSTFVCTKCQPMALNKRKQAVRRGADVRSGRVRSSSGR